MKAVVMTGVGGPEVLAIRDVEKPAPGIGDLLVRVKAAGVNPIDYKVRKSGAFGAGAGTILGFDVAGEVEQVGAGVTSFKPGDRVFYSPDWSRTGGYAQWHAVKADLADHMPASLSFEQAAALPLSGMTAWDALFTRSNLTLGQTVLIAAANGGVGSLAVQMARAAGAFVIATCSARSMDFVKNIPVAGPPGKNAGPDAILDYRGEWWAEAARVAPAGLDLAFDCAGQDVVSRCIPLMKPNGAIATIVNPTGKLDEAYRKNVSIHYVFLQRKQSTLKSIRTVVDRGQLVPLIDSVLPLEQAADAHRKLEAGGVQGKIVLKVE